MPLSSALPDDICRCTTKCPVTAKPHAKTLQKPHGAEEPPSQAFLIAEAVSGVSRCPLRTPYANHNDVWRQVPGTVVLD